MTADVSGLGSGIRAFGSTARGLSRNPLGILALFLVLIYGFAALVIIFAQSLTSDERLPLVWFLVLFPVAVLAVFAWLVSAHSTKLYAPGDFKEEANWVDLQVRAAVSLGAAATRGQDVTSVPVDQLVAALREATSATASHSRRILWVDDRLLAGNAFARDAFQAMGFECVLAASSDEALSLLGRERYDAIISDMRRPESESAGHELLEAVRSRGIMTPFFIHTGQLSPQLVERTARLNGQGHTANSGELFQMVVRAIGRS